MNLEIIPDEFGDDNSFQAWFKASETANFTKDERIEYDKIMMTKTDIRYGMELRYKEGHAAGVAEGHAAGVAEGSAAAKLEMAKAMLAKGISAEVIADCSGLTLQQIQSL